MATQECTFLTPPAVAARLGISSEKVVGFILAGELKGVNLQSASSSRPRYRVSEEDLADFLESRNASVVPRPARKKKKPARTFYK